MHRRATKDFEAGLLEDLDLPEIISEGKPTSSSVGERFNEDDPREIGSRTLFDLLVEVWNSACSVSRNVASLLACVRDHPLRRKGTNSESDRSAIEVKIVLEAVRDLWLQPDRLDPIYARDVARDAVRVEMPKVYATLNKVVMSREIFEGWVRTYGEYRTRTSAGEESGRGRKRGFEQLFEEEFEERNDRFPQQVTKTDSGRWLTLKTPGETESCLVRVYVYDTKDLVDREKRDWWKVAKVRSQFLCRDSETDCKYRLVTRLMEEVVEDLTKVPGLMKESAKKM